MKPLRLTLTITLFILSGVLAWACNHYNCVLPALIGIGVGICVAFTLCIWALGGFDD